MAKDYYKILGVEKNASDEDIKKAYRKLAHQYHPDKTGGDGEKFKEINEAYQILSSQEKRRQYDQFGQTFDGASGFSQGGPASGWDFGQGFPGGVDFDFGNAGDFGSIFEGIFEGLGVRRKRRTVHSGSDIKMVLEISLEEVLSGSEKELNYETLLRCDVCGGKGHEKDSGFKTCEHCDGRGEIRETRQSFFGAFAQVKECPYCFGEGRVAEKICKICHGKGKLRGQKKIKINIQSGINDGQMIKVAGAGEDGGKGGSSGDLYVEVRIKPHAHFKRQGADLILEIKISFVRAILGGVSIIPILDGKKLEVEIPSGTEHGKVLRIKNKGLPYFGRLGRGDLLLAVSVDIPKKVSAKVKEALEKIEGEI